VRHADDTQRQLLQVRELRQHERLQLDRSQGCIEMAEQASLNFEHTFEQLKLEAQFALDDAKRLAWKRDPTAESAFTAAEALAIKCPDLEIQMRAFAASAQFQADRGADQIARKKYLAALAIAQQLGTMADLGVEYEDRIRWAVDKIDNRHNSDFQNLVVALKSAPDVTAAQRRKLWSQFKIEQRTYQDLVAARELGSVGDFADRIAALKSPARDED
jgi:hypothetical protein